MGISDSNDSALDSGRIPALDGWRGIAILFVLFAHFQQEYLHHPFFNQAALIVGQHGVSIFFVVSGFLITSKLLDEEQINLKRFYARRFFRIVPASLVYLLFLCALTFLTPIKAIGVDFWQCMLFFRNYVGETVANTCTAHFWSLSMEEQFYFAWPLILAVLKPKRGGIVAASLIGVVVLLRHLKADYYAVGLHNQHTEVRADALLVGCLLALMLRRAPVRQWIARMGATVFCLSFIVFIFDVWNYNQIPPLHEQVAIALMVASTSLRPFSVAGRLLQLEHLRTTGLMSYSIYLWQQLFLRANWGPLAFFLLIAASLASWMFVEQPAIRYYRRRYGRARESEFQALAHAHAMESRLADQGAVE